MADVYEVVSLAKIEDAASGGDEVQVTLRRKWAEQDDGSYAPQVETASGGVAGAATDNGPAWTSLHKNVNSADATGEVAITDAPTAGQKIVLTDIVISVGTAMSVTIKEATSGTVMLGPYYMAANSTIQVTPRGKGPKTAVADRVMNVDASAAGNITVDSWWHSEA